METLSSSAAIVSSSSSPLSFFSPKRKELNSPPRLLRFHTSSKKDNKDSDLQSNSNDSSIVPLFNNPTLSKDAAMGLVLSAASVRGWTTGSGMEGPSVPAGAEDGSNTEKVSTLPWSLFTKSPRRRMRVAFTCNVCGQRTTRAINPHAYTDGTVFVQFPDIKAVNLGKRIYCDLRMSDWRKMFARSGVGPSARGNIFTYAVHRQYIASTLQIRVQEELKEQGRGSLM
ncbi:hypothetical protein POTOM_022143 [Populus tomentosa]|uniref:DNL-type domain-containing protein n=1 Tax=Populus tomentosa TaxID=118781 RepID=A0A8X8D1J9_POPTO|nr:hypothetical protein POTOM_022143 [Populus tomentosa]